MKRMRTDPREGCSGTVKGDKSGKTVCYLLPPENLVRPLIKTRHRSLWLPGKDGFLWEPGSLLLSTTPGKQTVFHCSCRVSKQERRGRGRAEPEEVSRSSSPNAT